MPHCVLISCVVCLFVCFWVFFGGGIENTCMWYDVLLVL